MRKESNWLQLFAQSKEGADSMEKFRPILLALGQKLKLDLQQMTEDELAEAASRISRMTEPPDEAQTEQQMKERFAVLKAQFAAMAQQYPQAELRKELTDPAFARLIASGVDAKSAYELTHMQELLSGAMAYGIGKCSQELLAAIGSGMVRPREGALEKRVSEAPAEDPRRWSAQKKNDMKTRARRGERICF